MFWQSMGLMGDMADFVDNMPSPVFVIDRVLFVSRAALIDAIVDYLENGAIVQVEDSARPRRMQFCYEIRSGEAAFHLFNAHVRQFGVFASVTALVDHAEAVTAV